MISEYTEPLSNNTGFEVASSLGSHDYQAVGGDGEADLRAAVSPVVLQKVASELDPKVRNYGEGPY